MFVDEYCCCGDGDPTEFFSVEITGVSEPLRFYNDLLARISVVTISQLAEEIHPIPSDGVHLVPFRAGEIARKLYSNYRQAAVESEFAESMLLSEEEFTELAVVIAKHGVSMSLLDVVRHRNNLQ